jgi:4-hydroxy-tetrahydrodipicolinate reductase
MGQALRETASAREGIQIVAMAGRKENLSSLPEGDLILDFSRPEMALHMADLAHERGLPFITGTTGFSSEELEALEIIGKDIPLLVSANFSVGIAVLAHVLEQAGSALGAEWDVELMEIHHHHKEDAPSGTAIKLLTALDPEGTRKKVYGRQGFTGLREKGEIGIHALRGGSVVGEHQVHFFGAQETLQFIHRAESRQVFALGAWVAAERLIGMPPGYYSLNQLLFR